MDTNGLDVGNAAGIPEGQSGPHSNLGVQIEGIDLGDLTTEALIKEKYTVVAMGGCNGGSTGGGGNSSYDFVVRVNGWSVYDDKLNVRFDAWSSSHQRCPAWASIFLVSKGL